MLFLLPLDCFINDRYPVFTGEIMIDTFDKCIYRMYCFNNENNIKMNDSMIDILLP